MYHRLGKFRCEKIFIDHIQGRKLNRRNIFSTYKWSKFILSSRHSNKDIAGQKFKQRNILPPKNFLFTVFHYLRLRDTEVGGATLHDWIGLISREEIARPAS